MSKAYLVYFLMFAVAVGGLWVILTLGAAARAPDDLSGEWTVQWDGTPPVEFKDNPMRVSQSGRYFTVRFGNREPLSFTLEKSWQGARDGRTLHMKLASDASKLDLRGEIPLGQRPLVGEMRIVVSGPTDAAGIARRAGFEPTTRPAGTAHAQ
jgi:hypothetical protein